MFLMGVYMTCWMKEISFKHSKNTIFSLENNGI